MVPILMSPMMHYSANKMRQQREAQERHKRAMIQAELLRQRQQQLEDLANQPVIKHKRRVKRRIRKTKPESHEN